MVTALMKVKHPHNGTRDHATDAGPSRDEEQAFMRVMEGYSDIVRDALDNAEVSVGCVHGITPHAIEEYGDLPGAALMVSWLEADGQVVAKAVWIPWPLLPMLFAVSDTLRSQEFATGMDALAQVAPGGEC
ncbi:hypothetical protein SMC26_05080 [Actinomadura fulvescens]|uniref:DUF3806 domain-containing protein n=1 Tax=Actinomadura fulvescens TaxID=46160 RepID=A0ABN3Q6U4_9ACTN